MKFSEFMKNYFDKDNINYKIIEKIMLCGRCIVCETTLNEKEKYNLSLFEEIICFVNKYDFLVGSEFTTTFHIEIITLGNMDYKIFEEV